MFFVQAHLNHGLTLCHSEDQYELANNEHSSQIHAAFTFFFHPDANVWFGFVDT